LKYSPAEFDESSVVGAVPARQFFLHQPHETQRARVPVLGHAFEARLVLQVVCKEIKDNPHNVKDRSVIKRKLLITFP